MSMFAQGTVKTYRFSDYFKLACAKCVWPFYAYAAHVRTTWPNKISVNKNKRIELNEMKHTPWGGQERSKRSFWPSQMAAAAA